MNFQRSTDSAQKFGDRLRIAFGGVSNVDIARRLNLTKSTVGNYIDGRIPPAETLIEISKLTNCSLHWLITGEGPQCVQPEPLEIPSRNDSDESIYLSEAKVREIVHEELARAFQQFAQAQSAQTVITNTTNANFRFTNQR
jgi:transcriptional regulator with XRE-family HTH domain